MTAYGGGFRVHLQQQQMSFLVESADRMTECRKEPRMAMIKLVKFLHGGNIPPPLPPLY